MNANRVLATIIGLSLSASPLYAGDQEEAITDILRGYLPPTAAIGKVKTQSVKINNKKRTVIVEFTKNASYIPLTSKEVKDIKAKCLNTLGKKYAKYKIELVSNNKSFDQLAINTIRHSGPKEKTPFVHKFEAPAAPQGLDGTNIAMWQSHGWYFEPKLNRWEWQRARVMQTVEDLYTQSYVLPFLTPMLQNAGAYVLLPRERDTSRTEIIIDNDADGQVTTEGTWKCSGKAGFAYNFEPLKNGDHPFAAGTSIISESKNAKAKWQAPVPAKGTYAVYVGYTTEHNSTDKAFYTINAADGKHQVAVNQQMGGGTWVYLGHYPFDASTRPATLVEVTNQGNKGTVLSADAVKIGGGMGNVARIVKEPLDDIEYEYITSGYPRFTEGARYFLQWAGAPDSVFTPSDYVNDYTDDYRSRGLWVNWLAGGSSMLPDREGLNIPVDLSFAFHSDAGMTPNDSIIGTLGIYCTKGDKTGNGSPRAASRDLTNLVMTNIVDDIRATMEPNWSRRGMWDESYFEARAPEVPAMLLELLSHQNLADMSYGLDPAFRFVVSRAIYSGMLQFLAARDGRPYVVQPLPIRAFAINSQGNNTFSLSWKETVDTLEKSATPTYYIIEERIGDGHFRPLATSKTPTFNVTVTDGAIHSYRIIAANDGGVSFPSEVLALCDKGGKMVTVVNGFTRVSAPDRFDFGEVAGFYDERDHGVPYIEDISYIGSQYEYRRIVPWMDDDAAGFGGSRSNYEDKVIAGNTFDYVYTHGKAIADAGYSFISSSVEAFTQSQDTPMLVDLILGKQKEIKQGRGAYGTRFKAFPSALQQRMAALADNGCSFFVSGAFVATDMWDNPNSTPEVAEADKKFANEVLGYTWRVGQASVTGEAYQVPTRFKDFTGGEYAFSNSLNSECYAVESPDSFFATNKDNGCTLMRYSENNLVAGIAFDSGKHRSVVLGFPFETIKDDKARSSLMKQTLNFFNDPSPRRSIKK